MKVRGVFKFYIIVLALASLWYATAVASHARTGHACSCAGCANGACRIGCPHTGKAEHTVSYFSMTSGSIFTCSCAHCQLPESQKTVAVIEPYVENLRKVTGGSFHAALGPAAFKRCGVVPKTRIPHIPTVRQLYILNSSLLL